MGWLARVHALLWLVPLGVLPALALDLARVPPAAAAGWRAVMALALWLGFPYYAVETALGALMGTRGTPSPALHLAAAAVSSLSLLAGDRALGRRAARRRDASVERAV